MATISNTPRPGYVWDATDNVWYPIGTGPHSHADYITSSSAINPNIVDAKGDIIAATAADTVARLAVGANDTVLTADSSTATGLKWAAVPTGGITLISSQTPAGVSSLSFGSISGSYKQLLLVWAHLSHLTTSGTKFALRFNNDSGSNYARYGTGYTAAIVTVSGTDTYACFGADHSSFGTGVTSTLAPDSVRGSMLIDNYASTSLWKQYRMSYGYYDTQLAGQRKHCWLDGQYMTTTAITSIDIVRVSGTGTLSANSGGFVRLYGIS